MKAIDTGKEKVRQICDVLRRDTLEPAKRQAEQMVQAAEKEAERLIEEAKKKASELIFHAQKEIEIEKNVFQSSLNQACKRALESLKEDVEQKLFNEELSNVFRKPLEDPKVIADLIRAVISALEKEGIDANLDVIIPKVIPAKEINAMLSQEILRKLKVGSVSLGAMQGGIEVRIAKDNMIIDMTDAALKEMVAKYIRKDFREILFRAN